MNITSRRLPNGQHQLSNDAGEPVGRAWRRVGSAGFSFSLNGIYWRNGKPNTRAGASSTQARTLRECRAIASTVFSQHGYGLPTNKKQQLAAPAAPQEPTLGLLMSMALRYDHGLGAPGYYDSIGAPGDHAKRLESTLRTMRKLWDEVVGQGFYMPEREAEYAALAAAPEVK